jgi:glycosyltransferase involved in cell wall biosynthesis
MLHHKTIALIMPAQNEAENLPDVLRNVPDVVDQVIVVDNGSTDNTAEMANRYGATVVREPVAGYGRACLAGLSALSQAPPDIVLFADADGSDDLPGSLKLLAPVAVNTADFALAARASAEKGALSLHQKYGNRLAVFLISLFWGHAYADLGPMRAISWASLMSLGMREPAYGWTVEMQVKAVKAGLRVMEFPTPYRNRIAGKSKVSKTFIGAIRAGATIIRVILGEAATDHRRHRRKSD